MFGTLALDNSDLIVLILICFCWANKRVFRFWFVSLCDVLGADNNSTYRTHSSMLVDGIFASVFMIKNGWKDSNKKISIILWLGAIFGLPIGIFLTTILDFKLIKLLL